MSARDLEEPPQLDGEDVASEEAEPDLDDLEEDDLDLDEVDEEVVLDLDEDEEEDGDEGDEDDEGEDTAGRGSGGDESVPASLDEILAKKPDPRRSSTGDDEDIMSVVSGGDEIVSERLPSRITPLREREEFVCQSCFLVKSRAQLADRARQLCRDCV